MKSFKKGDKVKVLNLKKSGGSQSYIGQIGTITHWGNSGSGPCVIRFTDGIIYHIDASEIEYVGKYKPDKKTKVAPPKFDDKAFDRLVLEKRAKEEILAVLKQHKHADTLFETWGLGETIEYGRGMTFLFYGPPGTGKTWATHCIGKALGKEIITIGAAEIQTSEPGGSNRNIVQAFKTAKEQKKILFIDECDSLVSSRQDLGMVLGSEVNTLLVCIEKFEGILVLATNRVENLDAALERRISLIVEFAEPDYANRREIWSKILPKKLPLAKEVTLDKLAQHKLTGGQIKNVLLQAARLALASDSKKVTDKHFDVAITRLQASKSLLGSASRYGQKIDLEVGTKVDKTEEVKEII